MCLDLDGQVSVHYGNWRDSHVVAQDDGAGPLINNNAGYAIGFHVQRFEFSDEFRRLCAVFSGQSNRDQARIVGVSDYTGGDEVMIYSFRDSRGCGEIGILQLQLDGIAELDRGGDALDGYAIWYSSHGGVIDRLRICGGPARNESSG